MIQIGYQEFLIENKMADRLKLDLIEYCKLLKDNNIVFSNALIAVPVDGKVSIISKIEYDDIK